MNKKRDNRERFKILIESLRTNPKDPKINFNIGVFWLFNDQLKKALLHFRISVDHDCKNSKYWLYYLFCLFKLNETNKLGKSFLELKKMNLKISFYEIFELRKNFSSVDKFILKYINYSGFYISTKKNIVNFNNEKLALLTNTFLFWFETQNWKNLNLLELGSGNSTFYFSNYFKYVTSYENNNEWLRLISKNKPGNVKLIKTNIILESIFNENLNKFDVILIDPSENRASITKEIIKKKFEGIIFFDNSDLYRESIKLFTCNDYLEIPFFGLKPLESNISCTSLLIKKGKEINLFDPNWVNYPFLTNKLMHNLWDKV